MKVIVVGGGIGGLTAALSFSRRGFAVEVVEQAHESIDTGAGIQLSPNAMFVLRRLGCEPALLAVGCEPVAGVLRHYRNNKLQLLIPMGVRYQERYSIRYLQIHRSDLMDVLRKALTDSNVTVHTGLKAQNCEQDENSVRVRCEGGASFEADLLVGADGIHSGVREAVLGRNTIANFTGHVAWRGLVPAAAVPKDLRPEQLVNIWTGPGRHFVCYYLRQGELLNFVAVEERPEWTAEDWNLQDNMDNLRRSFAEWNPVVQGILEACPVSWLWGLFDHSPLESWSRGRIVLLGDACHAMLPFQAQGAAMAIEDAYVLAARCAVAGDDLERLREGLLAYEAERKPRTTLMQTVSRINGVIFHAKRPLARIVQWLVFALGRWMPGVITLRLDRIYALDVTEETPSEED